MTLNISKISNLVYLSKHKNKYLYVNCHFKIFNSHIVPTLFNHLLGLIHLRNIQLLCNCFQIVKYIIQINKQLLQTNFI